MKRGLLLLLAGIWFAFGASAQQVAFFAAGIAHDSSLAAFNTYGEYDRLTFKVACLDGHNPTKKDPRAKELLYIGADGDKAGEIVLTETMPPTEYSVPLNRCDQLMFWLKCGDDSSGEYLFYDLVLHRD